MNYGFYDMAQLIHQHRIANNISSTVDQAISDLEAYTRARFPQIAAIPSTTNAQPRVSGCRSCGR